MNIVILGGTGFIGRHVSTGLAAVGHRVSVFSRSSACGTWADIAGIHCIAGDMNDLRCLRSVVENADLVIHLVSTSLPKTSNEAPYRDLHENVGSTLKLLDILASLPRLPRVLFVSSGGTVYGVPETIPIPEIHPTNPLCAYGIGKLTIEKYLALYQRLHGLEYHVLRLANPYGEWQPLHSGQGVIPVFLDNALQGKTLEIWGDGSVIRDYLYVGDVVTAVKALIDYDGAERIFNIGSGHGHTLNELVELMSAVLGRKIPCQYMPARPCDVPVNVLDVSRARCELCWQSAVSLENGMQKMIRHLQKNMDKDGGRVQNS
jgi:UDP-glucose 4-epimerase